MASSSVLMLGGAGVDEPIPAIVPGEERWGMNALIKMRGGGRLRFEGVTHWFDLHTREHIRERKEGDMWGWYRGLHIPVYLIEKSPEVPFSETFPLADVQQAFDGTRLFSSGLDYMLAFAIFRRLNIRLYGFRMMHPNYTHQVGSAAWWLKMAHDRGITVTFLSPSSIASFKTVEARPPKPGPQHLMYGFETTDRSRLYRGY